MTMELLAPAKINLGLEVIRRRDDGYHDIATVLQTITVFDRVRLRAADRDEVQIVDRIIQIEANLAARALELATASGLTKGHHRVEIEKRIPIAAGLGGASADAAAVLRGLCTGDACDRRKLAELALHLGSDVPFLLHGGAALATGRGEVLESLSSLQGCWLVLASPDFELERKTTRLYGALRAEDFSDGSGAMRVAEALKQQALPTPSDLHNAFARALSTFIPEIDEVVGRFRHAGAPFVALSGAGPTHFTIVPTLSEAISMSAQLTRRPPLPLRVLVARPAPSGMQLRRHKTHGSTAALQNETAASSIAAPPRSIRRRTH
jgi:4-diphosphocytidyl-2-C-methyl-D-erythritol kinase